jgi:hypothetical protein
MDVVLMVLILTFKTMVKLKWVDKFIVKER